MKLEILIGSFSVHRFCSEERIPAHVLNSSFYSITKTDEELSIVCPSSIHVSADHSEADWSCIKIVGPLDFSLTGIIAKISTLLAQVEISIFTISTYDTDYILVKTDRLGIATKVLTQSGYTFI